MSNTNQPFFIVVGPSGVGKSSFLDKIVLDNEMLVDAITNTTRKMRAGESEGLPYNFIDTETFLKRVDEDYYAEWARVHDNYYGTPYSELESIWEQGKAVIMDVDVQGAKALIKKFPQCVSIFILPPSVDVLRQRVRARDGHRLDEENLKLRMLNAEKEIVLADTFTHQLVNDEFSESYKKFKKIIEESLALS